MKVIIIDRAMRTLELWQGSKGAGELLAVYSVAIGMPRYKTPRGVFFVDVKERNPDWKIPDSPWMPEERWGEIVSGDDPLNPLKARWIGVIPDQGIGIHGTDNMESIGTAASHGCVRMLIDDVKALYEQVPDPEEVPTPVIIE